MADLPFFVELNEQNLTETLQRSVETPLVINFYAPSHQESADFAKVQLLLETVTDSTHRRFTLPDSSFTLDYEKHELHDKILLEHSIHCSFPQDDEGE